MPLKNLTSSPVPKFKKTASKVLASTLAGATFSQSLVEIETGGGTAAPIEEPLECIIYSIDGNASLIVSNQEYDLTLGSYVYIPPATKYTLRNTSAEPFRFLKLDKPRPKWLPAPQVIHGNEKEVQEVVGRRGQSSKSLLNRNKIPFLDFLFNIITAQPNGGTAFIEMHVEEHGLLFKTGEGTYSFLREGSYPVKTGDYMWVGPYTPHIFTNTGSEPCTYIFYKGSYSL